MISINVKAFCCDDISLIENYDKAINDSNQTWHCHHRLETDLCLTRLDLIKMNKYYGVPASELIFLTKSEHSALHGKYRVYSIESKQKMSDSHKGKVNSIETRQKISDSLKGYKWSEESRKKLSETNKGTNHRGSGWKLTEETKNKHRMLHLGKTPYIKGKHRVYDNDEHTKYHYE